jgi:hypothetical protein
MRLELVKAHSVRTRALATHAHTHTHALSLTVRRLAGFFVSPS